MPVKSPIRMLQAAILMAVPATALAVLSAGATPMPWDQFSNTAWNSGAAAPSKPIAASRDMASESEIVEVTDWEETALRKSVAPRKVLPRKVAPKKVVKLVVIPTPKKVSVIRR